jgi:hypothetical protein
MKPIEGQEKVTRQATDAFCGRAFAPGAAVDEECAEQVEEAVASAYEKVDPSSVASLEGYLRAWWEGPAMRCYLEQVSASGTLSAEEAAGGAQCMADYVQGKRKLQLDAAKRDLLGEQGYIAWAFRYIKGHVDAEQHLKQIPDAATLAKIARLSEGDAVQQREMLRLFSEAMYACAQEERVDPAVRGVVSQSLLGQLEAAKRRVTKEQMTKALAITTVDWVESGGPRRNVVLRMPAHELPTRLAAMSSLKADDIPTLYALRRLFALAYRDVKRFKEFDDKGNASNDVSTHLKKLSPARREAFLVPIRERIRKLLAARIQTLIEHEPSERIPVLLRRLDVDVHIAAKKDGSEVSIKGIDLKKRSWEGMRSDDDMVEEDEDPVLYINAAR